jgi:hypothetical protein
MSRNRNRTPGTPIPPPSSRKGGRSGTGGRRTGTRYTPTPPPQRCDLSSTPRFPPRWTRCHSSGCTCAQHQWCRFLSSKHRCLPKCHTSGYRQCYYWRIRPYTCSRPKNHQRPQRTCHRGRNRTRGKVRDSGSTSRRSAHQSSSSYRQPPTSPCYSTSYTCLCRQNSLRCPWPRPRRTAAGRMSSRTHRARLCPSQLCDHRPIRSVSDTTRRSCSTRCHGIVLAAAVLGRAAHTTKVGLPMGAAEPTRLGAFSGPVPGRPSRPNLSKGE